jgi:tRNA A-37 threonylcarbamoyl transferase component Bud32
MVIRVHKVYRSKTLIDFLCRERVRMESQRVKQIVLHRLINRIVLTR